MMMPVALSERHLFGDPTLLSWQHGSSDSPSVQCCCDYSGRCRPKDTSSATPHCCRGNPVAPTVPATSAEVTIPEGIVSGNLKRLFVATIPSHRSGDPAL